MEYHVNISLRSFLEVFFKNLEEMFFSSISHIVVLPVAKRLSNTFESTKILRFCKIVYNFKFPLESTFNVHSKVALTLFSRQSKLATNQY